MAAAASRENQAGRINSMDSQKTTCLETFVKRNIEMDPENKG